MLTGGRDFLIFGLSGCRFLMCKRRGEVLVLDRRVLGFGLGLRDTCRPTRLLNLLVFASAVLLGVRLWS